VASTLEHYEQDSHSAYHVFDQNLIWPGQAAKFDLNALVSNHTFAFFQPKPTAKHHSFEFWLTAQCFLVTVGRDDALHLVLPILSAASPEGVMIQDNSPRLVVDEDFAKIVLLLIRSNSKEGYS